MEDGLKIVGQGVRIFPVGVKESDYAKSGTEISKNAGRRQARGIRRLYDRYKIRRRRLRTLLEELDMLPDVEEILSAKELYGLRKQGLDGKLSLEEFGRIILLLNQRRGFKSNRKSDSNVGSVEAKKEEGIKLQMQELEQRVRASGYRTIGEIFYSLYEANAHKPNWHNADEPVERIRTRFVYRKMYEEEFDLLWNTQKEFYPNVLTDANYKRIKLDAIFYQRPLQSQKHRVAKCRFEPKKRVAPKSSLEFQEFRIWQTLANIRVTDAVRMRGVLTFEEKSILAEELAKHGEMSHKAMQKSIQLSKIAIFNDLPEKIKGNTTRAKLLKALGEEYIERLSVDEIEHLWHVLYFANDEEWLKRYAADKLGLNEEQVSGFMKISLEPEYCRISTKAIRNILPWMREGYDYAEACKRAGYNHSEAVEDGNERELQPLITRKAGDEIDELRNPLVQQSLGETFRLVNAIIREYGKPDAIRVEMARSLKKSKKKREDMKKNNDEKDRQRKAYAEFLERKLSWKNISRGQLIKFELWLEMEYDKTDLTRLRSNLDLAEFQKFAKRVNPKDKEKYELWLECDRISPYTGGVISLGRLFSSDIDIEHIIPYSKSMDDSFMNKTLCEHTFNIKKGNLSPHEYFKDRPEEYLRFKERIKALPGIKQDRFLMEEYPEGFLNSQLTNTSIIATETVRKLKSISRKVHVTNGQATSILRRYWGLNTLLNPNKDNEKSRDDHRHHAIDAFVIANTTDGYINVLSEQIQFRYDGRMELRDLKSTARGRALAERAGFAASEEEAATGNAQELNFETGELLQDGIPGPYPNFRSDIDKSVADILVSYRNKKRLLSSKQNKYIHSHPSQGRPVPQRSLAVRGALHEEKLFGQIENPYSGKMDFVLRKRLDTFDKLKQVMQIVDPVVRETVRRHIELNGGETKMKEALKNPIWMPTKTDKKVPIHKVRIIASATSMIQLRPKENPKLFVAPGDNYCISIYEDPETKDREFETVSFFEAIQRQLSGKEITPALRNGKPLLQTLSKRDMVAIYEASPEEVDWENRSNVSKRLYRIVKLDATGRIGLALHNYSNVNPDTPKDYPLGVVRKRSTNTLQCVKVRLSPTGSIIRATI
jgi:CRISPR-associated endonuclease Csn1